LRQITGSCDLMLFAQRSLWAALNSNTLPSQTYCMCWSLTFEPVIRVTFTLTVVIYKQRKDVWCWGVNWQLFFCLDKNWSTLWELTSW